MLKEMEYYKKHVRGGLWSFLAMTLLRIILLPIAAIVKLYLKVYYD